MINAFQICASKRDKSIMVTGGAVLTQNENSHKAESANEFFIYSNGVKITIMHPWSNEDILIDTPKTEKALMQKLMDMMTHGYDEKDINACTIFCDSFEIEPIK